MPRALSLALTVLLFAQPAAAQVFPPDASFQAISCCGGISQDPLSAQPGANGGRDIVGRTTGMPPEAALYYADDTTYL
jgi:hypothetical protein